MAAEKNFENQVKKFLQSKGIYPLGTPKDKMNVVPVGYYEKRHGSVFTKSGLPDLHICIMGQSIEVELKSEVGKPSELQLFMIEQINDCGGRALVLRPSSFEKFKDFVGDFL